MKKNALDHYRLQVFHSQALGVKPPEPPAILREQLHVDT